MDVVTLTVLRYTVNYEPMVEFYRDILGMEVVESWDRPDSKGSVFAPRGSVANATVEVLDLAGVGERGVAPVNVVLDLFVDDARAEHDRLLEAGVPIARGLEDASWGHRSFGLDDPDGLRVWIIEVLDPPNDSR